MARLIALILACVFLAAPSADALCKANCTPVEVATPPCHEMGPAGEQGTLTAARACQRDALLVATPTDLRREPVSAAAAAGTVPPWRTDVSPCSTGLVRPPTGHRRPVHACLSCVVLRI